MPPFEKRLSELELLFKSHQHTGGDFTQTLRNQDLQQIGRTVLVAAATSISVTVPLKRFIRILISFGAKSGASDDNLTFNGDTGSNYTFIVSGGTARTSQAEIDIRDAANSALGGFAIIEIANNLPTIVKPFVVHVVDRITNAGTAQTSFQIFGTWVNTANQISTITLTSSNSETYPVNSEIVILSTKQ